MDQRGQVDAAGTTLYSGTHNFTDATVVGIGGMGTIGGSIALNQVAVGSGANTIGGSSALTFATGGLSNLQSIAGECGFIANQAVSGAASNAYFYMQTPTSAGILRLTTAGFTPGGLVKANQLDLYGGAGTVEMLLRLQDANRRFVFGINDGEAMAVHSTTTENLVLGSPDTGAVPRNAAIKFQNATNANYWQFRAVAFGASRIVDLPIGSPTGTQALVGSLAGSTITLAWGNPAAALTASQVGFGDGSNLLTGSADFLYDSSVGQLAIVKTQGGAAHYSVTNDGTATDSRAAVVAQAFSARASLYATGNNWTTVDGIVANSSVLESSTLLVLKAASGQSIRGLIDSTEYLRITSSLSTVSNLADKGGQVYNVKAYGAVGDGITNDAAAFQAAINAAAAPGGVVLVPNGIYKINSSLTLQKSTQLVGEGQSGWDAIATAANMCVLDFTAIGAGVTALSGPANSANIRVANFRIDGPNAAPTTVAFNPGTFAQNVIVENCFFYHFGTQIYLNSCKEVTIRNNWCEGGWTKNLYVLDTAYLVSIGNNYANGATGPNVVVEGGVYCNFYDAKVDEAFGASVASFQIISGTDISLNNMLIFYTNGGYGLRLGNGVLSPTRVTLNNVRIGEFSVAYTAVNTILASGSGHRFNNVTTFRTAGGDISDTSTGSTYFNVNGTSAANLGMQRVAANAMTGDAWRLTSGLSGYGQLEVAWLDVGQGSNRVVALNGSSGSLSWVSGAAIVWNNNASAYNAGSNDTSIVRAAAGVVGIRNGSTGGGNLLLGTSTVGAIGSSGVSVLGIANGTAPTTSPADTAQAYTADVAAGDANLFARNELGFISRLTGCLRVLNQEFASTSTTLANVVGSVAKYDLSHNVASGQRYRFKIWFTTDNSTTGGVKVNIAGTATFTHSRASYKIIQLAATGLGIVDQYAEESTFSTAVSKAATTGLNFIVEIEGSFIVNAAGTVLLQFAQETAAGTSKVRQGAYFELSMSE